MRRRPGGDRPLRGHQGVLDAGRHPGRRRAVRRADDEQRRQGAQYRVEEHCVAPQVAAHDQGVLALAAVIDVRELGPRRGRQQRSDRYRLGPLQGAERVPVAVGHNHDVAARSRRSDAAVQRDPAAALGDDVEHHQAARAGRQGPASSTVGGDV